LQRLIRVDRVPAVDEQIGRMSPHRFVQAIAAPIGIDAEPLPAGIRGKDDGEVSRCGVECRRGLERAGDGLAGRLPVAGVFVVNAVEDALTRRQAREIDGRGEVGRVTRNGSDPAS
jgi:hypothetical protein